MRPYLVDVLDRTFQALKRRCAKDNDILDETGLDAELDRALALVDRKMRDLQDERGG